MLVQESCKSRGRISEKRDFIHIDRHEVGIKSDSDVYSVIFPTQMVPRKARQH